LLPSNKIHREIGRAKDLQSPRYNLSRSTNPCWQDQGCFFERDGGPAEEFWLQFYPANRNDYL